MAKQAARGTNSVNGRGSIAKITVNGKPAGYRAKVQDPNRPGKYITKRFKIGQKELANAWLKNEIGEIDRAASLGIPYIPPSERKQSEAVKALTFREYALQYLTDYRSPATGEKVRESTMRNKRVTIGHLIDYFGDTLLRDIKTKDIRACLDVIGEIGPYPRKRALQELRAMMRLAAMDTDERPALIDRNPCEGVPLPSTPDSEQAKIPPATPEEIQVMYEAMPEYTRIAVLMAVAFGLRISEACSLQVRDVDLKHKRLYVRHGLERGEGDVGEYHLAPTKTEASNADVPIPDALIEVLRRHIADHCDVSDDAMLLRPEKSTILSPNTLRKQFAIAREKAGRPDLHFHTLRATYDDRVSREAENAKEYMAATRRSDVATGIEHYQRTNDDRQRELVNKAYDKLVKGPRTVETVRRELEETETALACLQTRREALRKELEALTSAEMEKNRD